MCVVPIRAALKSDLPRLTEIYNHYVIHTPVTFDLEPYTIERRAAWFEQFGATGRYRLLVAEGEAGILGYAGTTRFRSKAAYDTTVETTIYCAPDNVHKGTGSALYSALFDEMAGEDIHKIVAGYTLPNPASAALHARFGFTPVGVFHENGRKFGRYWDVAWNERPLKLPALRMPLKSLMRGFFRCRGAQRDLFGDRQAVTFERDYFFRMIGQNAQAFQSQVD